MIREDAGGRQSLFPPREKTAEKLIANRLRERGAIRRPPLRQRRLVRPPAIVPIHDRENVWAWIRQLMYDPQPIRRQLQGQSKNGTGKASADRSRRRLGRFRASK